MKRFRFELSKSRTKLCAALALMVLGRATSLWAGTFSVNPVRIELFTNHTNAILQVSNDEDDEVTFQIRVLTWSTDGKKDVLEDTSEILVNPPIAMVAPHQKQFIRVGLRHPKEEIQEKAYRIIVEEVPRPPKAGFSGVQTLLRISIPVFIAPRTNAPPKLNWEAMPAEGDRWKLVAVNHGNAHVQIRTLDIANDGPAASHVDFTTPAYLLPNQQHEWLIDPAKLRFVGRVRVTANTDAGSLYEMVDTKH